MSITCDICGEWSPGTGVGHRDICDGCWPNFAGNPLEGDDLWDSAAPVPASISARDALAAFVDAHGPSALTPRQLSAMARLQAHWRQVLEG